MTHEYTQIPIDWEAEFQQASNFQSSETPSDKSIQMFCTKFSFFLPPPPLRALPITNKTYERQICNAGTKVRILSLL